MDSRKAGQRHNPRRSRISALQGASYSKLGVCYVCNQCVRLPSLHPAAPGGTWANSSKVADTGCPGMFCLALDRSGPCHTSKVLVHNTHSHTDTPHASSDEHV